jgi:hypothetical protein
MLEGGSWITGEQRGARSQQRRESCDRQVATETDVDLGPAKALEESEGFRGASVVADGQRSHSRPERSPSGRLRQHRVPLELGERASLERRSQAHGGPRQPLIQVWNAGGERKTVLKGQFGQGRPTWLVLTQPACGSPGASNDLGRTGGQEERHAPDGAHCGPNVEPAAFHRSGRPLEGRGVD